MKKTITLLLFVFCAFLAVSCDADGCQHLKTTEVVHIPTCTEEGYTTRICNSCGYTYNFLYVAPTGHKISTEKVSPTCTEEGYTTYSCQICEYEYQSDYIEPTGHMFTSSVTESTCTEGGYTTYTCGCGYYYKTKFTVPNGHHLTKSVTKPTCTEEGYSTYSCVCGYSYNADVVEPTGHDFKKSVVRPTISENGLTKYTCRDCEFSYKTDYVWYDEIFSGVEGNAEDIVAYGIDISIYNYQNNGYRIPDFEAIKNDGVDFVILRAGSIYSNPDELFDDYYYAAKAVGLNVGVYFYSYALSVAEVKDEVGILLNIIKDKTFEYPIYFDIEDKSQKELSVEKKMEMCHTFCSMLIDEGYFPGIYSYENFLNDELDFNELSTYYDVWLANYNYSSYNSKNFSGSCGMWQYTDEGYVDGLKGVVDLNVCYKNYPKIIKKYGYNGY